MPLLVCPNDGAGMQEVNRNGVLIDICPQCRGVWLDRGELEKLLELMRQPEYDEWDERGDRRDERYSYDRREGKPYRRKRSIFDFFDFD